MGRSGFIAVLAASVTWASASAQDAPPFEIDDAVRAPIAALQAAAAESDLATDLTRSLTTEIGPRLAGTDDEARARDWAVDMLTELGFENVRIETFMLDGWIRGEERLEVLSPYPQELRLTALGGSVAGPADGITAEVALVRDFDTLLEMDPGSLTGKIAFINGRMTPAQDGSGYGPANRKRQRGAVEAARRGAVGVVIRSVGTSTHRFPHTGQMSRYRDDVTPIPAAALSAPDADQLERMVEYAGDDPVTVRFTLTPQNVGPVESGNVIGEIVGRESPREIVLLGAHLDSWDQGTGALDDGAGVGIVTAAAKLIGDLPEPPRRTIRVVLFGAEEVGLIGARAYAERYEADLGDHVIAAESDFGARTIWRFDTNVGPSALPKTRAMNRFMRPLGVGPGHNRASGGPDLIPLRFAGVPVVSLVQNGFDYFEYHHTPNDTFDKIDPVEMRQNVGVYATFGYLAAELPGDFREPAAAN